MLYTAYGSLLFITQSVLHVHSFFQTDFSRQFSLLLSRSVECDGCETWSLKLREERSWGCLRTEHAVEENIWTQEGQVNGGMEEIA